MRDGWGYWSSVLTEISRRLTASAERCVCSEVGTRSDGRGSGQFAESALDTLVCGAQPGLMVRGSPAATGYRPTRQTRGLYKGGSTSQLFDIVQPDTPSHGSKIKSKSCGSFFF